jgi:hypothetical protein
MSSLRSVSVKSAKQSSSNKQNTNNNKNNNTTNNTSGSILERDPKKLRMEGYLGKNSNMNIGGKRELWERRYFTLNNKGHIYFYNSRFNYRDTPKDVINRRPLVLSDYRITVNNSDMPWNNTSSLSTRGSDGGSDSSSDEEGVGSIIHRTSLNFFNETVLINTIKTRNVTIIV